MPISLIMNCTPTGMIPMKSMTPQVQISVAEITEQVHEADELGITSTQLQCPAN
jgi:3-keto-5-aminohexanoate cleavage enzyme